MIDWSISVGNLLQIVAIIGGGMMMFFTMRADIRVLRHDMRNLNQRQEVLNEAFTQLGAILTQVANQDKRIDRVEMDIRELRHGQGYIKLA